MLPLLDTSARVAPPLALTPEIEALLKADAPIALSASGGKDSAAAALATSAYLDRIGHRGPRIVLHADLGRVEWRASVKMCESLAARLGLELVIVRRAAGDMLERWQSRWRNNVARYEQLQTVALIMPWSASSLRFCTSEMKTGPSTARLARLFPGQVIVNVVGIRRQESVTRAKAPIVHEQKLLTRVSVGTHGYDWHPIVDWTLEEVLGYHQITGFPLHEAYTTYGTSRVSCVACVLASQADLRAAMTCPENHDIYRAQVDLEIRSRFPFQHRHWLGDVAPHLLTAQQRLGLMRAKRCQSIRERAESRIPSHLRYTAGWPTVLPSYEEASLLAEVRRTVAEVTEIVVGYTDADAIQARYTELMRLKKVA